MKNLKQIFSLMAFLLMPFTMMAQEDITNQYLQNADLSSLNEGWDYGDDGFDYTDWNTWADVPVVEFYHTWGAYPGDYIGNTKNFHFTQTITLPAGDYRIAVSAFYREGNGDGTNTKAYIFAGDKQQYVYGLTSSEQADVNGTTGKYVGGSDLLRAANAFSKGDFSNAFDFSLTTEQEITLGFRGYIDTYCSWCILGPVKLYKYSLENYLEDYRAKVAEANALTGKMGAAEANALSDAIVQESSFSLSSEVSAAIATLTNAINAAKQSITDYATLEDALENAAAIVRNTEGVADGDLLATYDNAVFSIQNAYDAGTVTDFAGSIAIVEEAVTPLVKYQKADNSDFTMAIVNPHVNGSGGWTCERPYGGNGPMLGGDKFEYWAGNAYSREAGSFDYYQEIYGLPNGYYTVSASMYNSLNDEGGNYTVFSPTSGVYAASGNQEVFAVVDKEGTALLSYTTDEILVKNGMIRIGVKNAVTPMAARWFVADDFHLTLVRSIADEAIQFADATVKNICVENWDTNHDGELSYAEAAAVTDLGETFKENSSITSFEELQHFTGLTEIGEYAFSLCNNLSSIVIPNTVVTLRDFALDRTGLKSITIPKSVTWIGVSVLFGCPVLSSINVESGNPVYDSRDNCNAIIQTNNNSLIYGCETTIIPRSVTDIGEFAFSVRLGLKSIVIPNSVISIEQAAFIGCTELSSVSIPNSVYFIGVDAFEGCTGLSSITIPNSVNSLNAEAFMDCIGLTEVRSEIKEPYAIDASVFSNRVYESYQFTSATLYVPAGTKALYEATEGWNQFQNIVEMEGGTGSIPTDGLVAYYPFNGNANDESGHGNDGTPMDNVTLTTGVHGDANGAYQFGGTNNPGNIHIPNSESLQIGDGWSFAAYVKPMSLAGMTGWGTPGDLGRFCIMGKSHDQHGVAIDYEFPTSGSFVLDLSSWGWDELNATDNNSYHVGKWTHVAVTKSGNHYKMFINGEMMYEGDTEHDFSIANGEDMYLGKYNDSWYPMNGIMDEVCIYNRTLSDNEVRQMAQYAENEAPTISDIAIDATNFPDENFRNWLLNQDYGQDGVLTQEEIAEVTNIDVNNKEIQSLKGIEIFTALRVLHCYNNQLSSLDVSNNTALTGLRCEGNQLTSLDVAHNTALTGLNCSLNNIDEAAMDALVASLPYMKGGVIFVKNSESSGEGNVCTPAQVGIANAKGWTVYDGLDVMEGEAPATSDIAINATNFPDENFRNWILEQDYGQDGVLTQEEIEGITDIDVAWKGISNLTGINNFTALTSLECYHNQLTSLDVSQCTALTELSCESNQLTSLNVSHNSKLEILDCHDNKLASLNLSNTALTSLTCYYNKIKGEAMDVLIASLPVVGTGNLYAVKSDSREGNEFSTAQVTAAKQKGWKALKWDVSQEGWVNAEIEMTWTKVAIGTYYFSLLSNNDDGEPEPKSGYELYVRDDNPNYYKIVNWNNGTDFLFTLNQASNACSVADQYIGFDYGDYGPMYIIEGAKYSSRVNRTSYYDPASKTFHFSTIYYFEAGAFGPFEELFEITEDWGYFAVEPFTLVYEYNDEDKTATVRGVEGGAGSGGTLVIPETVEHEGTTYHVKYIGAAAFYKNENIASVTIPSSVTHIMSSAFQQCPNLTNVTLSDGLEAIGTQAFTRCTSLREITIPNTVKTLGEAAFYSCTSLQKATIGESVECIYDYTFANCSNLSWIIIPNSVTSIGKSAFSGCKYLQQVKIGDGVKKIDEFAFQDCTYLWQLDLGNSVEEIGRQAFSYCRYLGYDVYETGEDIVLTFPNTLKSIGPFAFMYCYLSVLNIPESLTSIIYNSFDGCPLKTITVAEGNPVYDSRDNCNAVIRAEDNELILGCVNTKIPKTVTRIGESAFAYCKLSSIEIPNSVTSIGYSAFNQCLHLTSLNIPESVIEIGVEAFFRCPLETITVDECNPVFDSRDNCNAVVNTAENEIVLGCMNTKIPNTITSIGDYAFENCEGLTAIEIPNSVTNIGKCAFKACPLTSISLHANLTSIKERAFYGCRELEEIKSYIQEPFVVNDMTFADSRWNEELGQYEYFVIDATLYVPAGTKALYEATEGWNKFQNIVEMEPVDVQPLHNDEVVTFDEENGIDEETDLSGNVIGNIFYNINTGDGGYNAAEGCITVTKPVSDEQVASLEGQDIFGEDFKSQFTGIVFKVPAGNGTVKVVAETTGNTTLKVKIGTGAPIEMELDGKLKASFPYSVNTPSYVYIYAGQAGATVKGYAIPANGGSGELKIYGIEVKNDTPVGIADVQHEQSPTTIYNLSGQRIARPQRGLNIINGHKIAIN